MRKLILSAALVAASVFGMTAVQAAEPSASAHLVSPDVSNVRPPLDVAPVGLAPPISSDPPFHHDARKLLLPAGGRRACLRIFLAAHHSW